MVSQFEDIKTSHGQWFVWARQLNTLKQYIKCMQCAHQFVLILSMPSWGFEQMIRDTQSTEGSKRHLDMLSIPLKIVSALNKRITMYMQWFYSQFSRICSNRDSLWASETLKCWHDGKAITTWHSMKPHWARPWHTSPRWEKGLLGSVVVRWLQGL